MKQKILAVTAARAALGYVDGTGTRRRIQALVADGWPMRRLADHMGISPTYVGDLVRRTEKDHPIRSATAVKVAQAYENLRTRRPARHGIGAGRIRHMRRLAAERKWPTVGYWATRMDVIDDPHFQPDYGISRREIVAQDAGEVMRLCGLDREAAAQRLGVSKSYIEHALAEYPEYAIEVAA